MANTRNILAALFLAFTLSFLGGCNARQVIRERDYGVVAIPSNSNGWPFHYRDKATEIMSKHFPEGYEIVREEEVVVGQTTHMNEDVKDKHVEVVQDVFSVNDRNRKVTTTTQDKTEWRISYQRASRTEEGVTLGGGYSPPGTESRTATRSASRTASRSGAPRVSRTASYETSLEIGR